MKVPDRYKEYQASIPFDQRRPWPCGYCFNGGVPSPACIEVGAARVFRGPLRPGSCQANVEFMDGSGECERFYPCAIDVKRHCVQDVFVLLQREWLMYCLSLIYERPGIPVREVVARGMQGHQARSARVDDIIGMGYATMTEKIDGTRTLELTYVGKRIAQAVRELYDDVLLAVQEGDPLDDAVVFGVMNYIRRHPWSDRRQIYDAMQKIDDPGYIIDLLLNADYIKAQFTTDWKGIEYDCTDKGIKALAKHSAAEMQ